MTLPSPPNLHSTLSKYQQKNILRKGLTTTKEGEAEEECKTSTGSKTEHQDLNPGAFVDWPLAFHSTNICSVPTV